MLFIQPWEVLTTEDVIEDLSTVEASQTEDFQEPKKWRPYDKIVEHEPIINVKIWLFIDCCVWIHLSFSKLYLIYDQT